MHRWHGYCYPYQFDPEGSAKAKDALKDANIEQGKKLKAKVTGTMEDSKTVRAASVEVNEKGKHNSAGHGSGAS